ncbi:MAG: peptidoglycan-binding domain-containing protein [bacterium]
MSNLLKSKFLLGAVMLLAFVVTTSSANAAITFTLKKGSKGPQVVELQTALKISPADGSFGAKTLAAVKVWQASKNLTADGVFGAKSRALLGGTVGTTCPIGDMNPATGLPCAGTTAGTLPIGCYAAQPVQMFS